MFVCLALFECIKVCFFSLKHEDLLPQAIERIQRLLGDLIGHRRPGANAIQLRIDVRDESGARVAMVTLAAVIE